MAAPQNSCQNNHFWVGWMDSEEVHRVRPPEVSVYPHVRMAGQRLLTSLGTLVQLLKSLENSKIKPPKQTEVTTLANNLKNQLSNFARLSTNEEYYTSYQRTFKDKLTILHNLLKSTQVKNSSSSAGRQVMPEDKLSLYVLLDEYDTMHRRKCSFDLQACSI